MPAQSSSGGGGVPATSPGTPPPNNPGGVPGTPGPPIASPTPIPITPGSSAISLTGTEGSVVNPHNSGDTFQYDETVNVTFQNPIPAGGPTYTITGSDGSNPPSSVYITGYGNQAQISVRKVPGIVYTLKVTSPVSYTATFSTPAIVNVPAPLRATTNEPYRYGILEHPFKGFLNATCTGPGNTAPCSLDSTAQQTVNELTAAGTRFVRIDYNAQGVLTDVTGKIILSSPNFDKQDAIIAALHARGITELPCILQYAEGPLLAGGVGYPHAFQWSSSQDPDNVAHQVGYADFAQAVVQHLAATAPWITRVELFNEENLHGWDNIPVAGNVAVDDVSGSEAGRYAYFAYKQIKAVAPGMTVVGPALATGGWHTDSRKFLTQMYTSISSGSTNINVTCRTGVCWDLLDVHNYDWESPTATKRAGYENQWSIYKQLQGIGAQYGDSFRVMLTEWGFSTAMSASGFDPQVQALYIAQGLNLMLADPTVDGIVYVNLFNQSCNPTCGGDFWGRTALEDANWNRQPAFYTFRKFSTGS
ncbi:MAG: hypothetical protein M3126_03030 [Candidatus Eremiobacteraeota bacterium]|nr:hypothetical protein [Candidatus Eremiobacteraeota bacterium]